MTPRHTHRNPADLIGLDRDPAVARLLRACGTDEVYVTGGASDYDKFLALAKAMPLCQGHPLRDQIHATLGAAIGLTVPLCPHTAHAIWETWTDICWYGRKPTLRDIPTICPLCELCEPTCIGEEDLAYLPDPMVVDMAELSAWSRGMEEAFLSITGKWPAYRLPCDYGFVRPDPYHAGEALALLAGGEEPTLHQRNLLLTQALRVWGQAALKIGWEGEVLLRGGKPAAVTALLAYLEASRALPPLTWIPDDPADAGAVSGLYARVGTGLDLSDCASSEEKDGRASAYAAVAPIGRAVVVR